MRPRQFGPGSGAKGVRGQTCVRRPERLHVCFGMCLVNGHCGRPLEIGPRCLAKRCAVSDLCSSANSAGPIVREAYDVRR